MNVISEITASKDSPSFSVILCTRNPRSDYLQKTLAAVEGQTIGRAGWELVVVDSGSTPPLQERTIDWPDGARIVRVAEPGVFRARMAGAFAARRQWIVFVDDDNVLDPDYLQNAADVIAREPDIGLFCGRIRGAFDEPPPVWLQPFHRQLAIIDFPADCSSREWDPARVPCWTAGMCIRTVVAQEHFNAVRNDPFLRAINRAEDVHLVMESLKRGHRAGLFRCLHLSHLIPPERMTPEYLEKISIETAYNVTRLRCREAGVTIRDLLRPGKNALLSMRHGLAPRGRIARAAAWGDFRGAWDSLFQTAESQVARC